MSGEQPIHICYYSNRCQWSKAFLTELATTPWKSQFRFICVDPSNSRPPLPSWLKKVPTIVLSGEPDPRTDSDVMNWLYEKKQKEGTKQQQQQGPSAAMGGEPDAFNMVEQGSFSRGFSYSGLDVDTSSQGDGGLSMPGAFSFLNGGAAFGDKSQGAIPGGAAASGRGKSKKEELFDKQMEAYQRERESGLPRTQQRM
jgi:hypothetical protein